MALTVNVGLAKRVAERCFGEEEEKKKLWLLIGRHVVEKERDIEKAMSVLKDTEHLKIEDILPFFPDFVRIGDFKVFFFKHFYLTVHTHVRPPLRFHQLSPLAVNITMHA